MLSIIRGASIAAATLLLTASAHQASAHITFAVAQAKPNSGYRAVLRVPHGCDGQATTSIRVTIPEGVLDAKPMPKPGWTISIKKGPYAKTYSYFGHPISAGAQEITWSNGSLSDDYYDEFVFNTWFSADLPAGHPVYFPVVQQCGDKTAAWTEIPAAGQRPHSSPHPAPGVMLNAANASSASTAATTYKVGAIVIAAPWAHATPKGAPVAGGYLRITNTGAEPDRLIGGTFPGAEQVETHEMKMDDGVMRMRPVPGGLEIKPGETITLKPGGLHLMFTHFTGQLKAGQPVTGTLTFAKAGTVTVTYQVAPIGAPGPKEASAAGGEMQMHMQH